MKRCFTLSLLFSFILPAIICGQNIDTTKNMGTEGLYIKKMSDYLAFKLSMNDDIKSFIVKNNTKSEIFANDKNVLKLSANYRWISGSFSYTPTFFPGNKDDALRGKTKVSALSLSFNFNHWVQTLSHTKVKGYYLKNTADYDPNWQDGIDPYIQFPDLVNNSFYGQTAYKFNKNFSFAALSTQTERQLRSTGTFMPSLSYNYYIIDDKTPLTGQNSSQKSNNFELLMSTAYYHTFVIHDNFYVSAGLVPGIGFISTKLLTRLPSQTLKTNYSNAIFRLEGTCALGYNSDRFFIGTQFTASTQSYNQNKTSNVVLTDRITYQAFLGYRIGAPKFLKNIMDKAEEKGKSILKKKK